MAPILEKDTKKRETEYQWPETRDVAHREDARAKLMNHIEATAQKDDKTLISEIPTSQRQKKYKEEMREEGYTARGGSLKIYRTAERLRRKP